MKVKNEYVQIEIGGKSWTHKNMILNTYLKKIFQSQIDTEHDTSKIHFCYLKLDTPIENIDYDTELFGTDFDIRIMSQYKPSVIKNKNNVKITYNYDDEAYFYNNNGSSEYVGMGNLNAFAGRKITAIGFGTSGTGECLAFLDTNNMNIIININESFRITRVDNIISDGIVKNFDYPLHLIHDISETTMAQLYSMGFGNTLGYIEEEYLIGDVQTDTDDNSITFNVTRIEKIGHYPSENLQLGFYPTIDNSKYLVFKYKLYRRYYDYENEQYVVNYLDKYYTMSKQNNNFGNLQIKLKIERS